MNRPITNKETEAVIKSHSPKKESPRPNCFTGESYQIFKELTPILLKLSPKNWRGGNISKLIQGASITLVKPKSDKDKKTIDQYPWRILIPKSSEQPKSKLISKAHWKNYYTMSKWDFSLECKDDHIWKPISIIYHTLTEWTNTT